MSKENSSGKIQNPIEREIQYALDEFESADLAADFLLKKYATEKLKLSSFQTLSTFFLHAGYFASLADFITRKLNDGSEIPWAHYAEALCLSVESLPEPLLNAFGDGVKERNGLRELSRTKVFDSILTDLKAAREHRLEAVKKYTEKKRADLLQEFELLNSQGLQDRAEQLLSKLQRLFPRDAEVMDADANLRRRQAANIVANEQQPKRKKKRPALYHYDILDSETESTLRIWENQMKEMIGQNPGLANDFAMAHLFVENYEGALRLMAQSPDGWPTIWLKAEIMLRGRLFTDLLDYLSQLEPQIEAEPDSTFAIYYLRAQALWGLNERQLAISIMESLVEARPQYRTAHSLLDDWREDLA